MGAMAAVMTGLSPDVSFTAAPSDGFNSASGANNLSGRTYYRYTGSQPATADTAASGTLLGTLTLSSDAFAAASAGAIAINSVTSDTNADASGTAGYVRFYRTGDTAPGSAGNGTTDRRLDLLIGTDISIDNASVVAGGTIALSAYTLTHA